MYRKQILRSLVNERLTAAVEEIFGVFERTIEEYEGEIDRQRQLLDALKPEIRTGGAAGSGCPEISSVEMEGETMVTRQTLVQWMRWSSCIDPPQLSDCEEEVPPEQQERSPSLGQEEPEPLHIKEEQEELWTSQEGEQLQGLEERDVIKFTSTPAPVKSEHDEEKPQSSWFNQTQTESLASTSTEQMKTEPNGEDCGVSEPASNLDPAGGLEPTRDVQILSSDCSGTETGDSDGQSGLNTLKSKKTQKNKGQNLSNSNKFKSFVGLTHDVKLSNHILSETWSCQVCGKCFPSRNSLMPHLKVHPSGCGLCGKHLDPTESLKLHLQTHRTCTVCGKKFTNTSNLGIHMRSHTGEKPYSCTLCHKRFGEKGKLTKHLRIHTGDKPFSCAICGKRFTVKGSVKMHMQIHTGEKPFSCSVCGKSFTRNGTMKIHMRSHTGEKPFSCSWTVPI